MFISIDGASRRNGKENCISSSGIFIKGNKEYTLMSAYENNSTNQRGEIRALILALQYFLESKDNVLYVLTDSEYVLNSIKNEWIYRWHNNGYINASGEPVKNKDLWRRVYNLVSTIANDNKELLIYYIKGHCIKLPASVINSLYADDKTGELLYKAFVDKYDATDFDASYINNVQELSTKNNGFALDDVLLRDFICCNMMADAMATIAVDIADKEGI